MDNQQETLLELGWTAGLIDGEGTIGISARNRLEASSGYTLKPHVQVTNTDPAVIARYVRWLESRQIPFHVSTRVARGRRLQAVTVTTAGLKRVQRLLPVVAEHLTGRKRDQAALVLEFVESRLADWHAAPFTPRQLEIVGALGAGRTKGRRQILRDYTRSSRSSKYPRDEDIVRAERETSGVAC